MKCMEAPAMLERQLARIATGLASGRERLGWEESTIPSQRTYAPLSIQNLE
jgi:hypothetical protein